MRIQVDWRRKRDGTAEPRSFVLGQHRLWVERVLEQRRDAEGRQFVVRTTDRRRFLLCEDHSCAAWKVAAVHAGQKSPAAAAGSRARGFAAYGAAIALGAAALWRSLRK